MTNSDVNTTGWAGWGVFAAVVLIVGGTIDAFHGLQALIGPDTAFFVGDAGLFSIDVQGWGWWHLITGLLLHLPGAAETWLVSAVLLLGWRRGWLGGGDAKLWLALVWIAPPGVASPAVIAGAVWLCTGAAQLAWRAWRGRRVMGVRLPGAWRALPFAAWLFLVS